jgi:hypothetical protein
VTRPSHSLAAAGKVQRWEEYQRRTIRKGSKKSDLDRTHQSFALLFLLELAYAAADIFPVEVISKSEESEGHVIRIAPRKDADREKLSELLGLDSPAKRLAKMLDADEVREEGAWTLSEPGMLGEKSPTTTNWRFAGDDEIDNIECFKFEGTVPPQHRSAAFLAPAGMVGRIVQLRRRLKALIALRQHAELLRMLANPRLRIDDTQDPLDESEEAFKDLDDSKKKALREILSTVPLFLSQGPPGVGKTYLVGDVVRRRFEDESTTRILLSAQSNSAINHLMSEVNDVFLSTAEEARPLMVRARSADDDEAAGELEIDIQADRLLHALSASDILDEASPHIGQRIVELSKARQASGTRQRSALGGRRTAAELRAFEGMILRAANLVFATTNSAAVERLIEERGLFDWTIVEEAGKATGGELLSPLLLSHRRLMIGDHKQLPPFDVDKVTNLLASTKQVMDVVSLIDDLVSRYLKDQSIDETFHEVETASEDFGKTCADTLAVLSLFETFVEREFARQKKGTKGRNIARRLEEQYRMHPAIARVVSTCFYDGALITNPKRERKFLTSPPPVISADSERLPDLPVIFIDTPYGREESPGGQSRDRLPPWWNPVEVNAVVRALELLRPAQGAETPTLAVLSPYWQQVGKIDRAITRKKEGTLSHLSGFAPAIEEKEFCGTVDSFQGGEADVVLVSLVRNNSHATPAKALGFLRDNRRMNVLLSRAKWRLVLVGSLSFYRNVLEISKKLSDQDIGFLGKFFHALDDAVQAKEGTIVSWEKLSGGKP